MEELIAVVLGYDVVGYSRLRNQSQESVLRVLSGTASAAMEGFRSTGGGQVHFSPAGDGGYMTFVGAETAVLGAISGFMQEIREAGAARKAGTEFSLRYAAHSGIVFVSKDADGRLNVFGDGINLASRLLDVSTAGRLLVSGAFMDRMQDVEGAVYERLGVSIAKHAVRLEVYNCWGETFGLPLPADCRDDALASDPLLSSLDRVLGRRSDEPGLLLGEFKSAPKAEGLAFSQEGRIQEKLIYRVGQELHGYIRPGRAAFCTVYHFTPSTGEWALVFPLPGTDATLLSPRTWQPVVSGVTTRPAGRKLFVVFLAPKRETVVEIQALLSRRETGGEEDVARWLSELNLGSELCLEAIRYLVLE